MLTRTAITNKLFELNDSLADRHLTILNFHRIVSNHIRNFIPVRIFKQLSESIDYGCVSMGGEYDAYRDEDSKKSIKIIIAYNTNDTTIKISSYQFKKLCILFADTVLHEVIHMRQYRRRNFYSIPPYISKSLFKEQREEQQYLGSTDEIDAYSFNIACELLQKFRNNKAYVLNYLEKQHSICCLKTNNWLIYLAAFGYNANHTIIKRLKKRVIRQLSNAATGKPYKTAFWLKQ
jgi:hypothetical protein